MFNNDLIETLKSIGDIGSDPKDLNITDATPIWKIGKIIEADWYDPFVDVIPYIDAMCLIHSIDDDCIINQNTYDGRTIIYIFLKNCKSWNGVVAKQIKPYLKQLIKY
jgi:hypothetical protein